MSSKYKDILSIARKLARKKITPRMAKEILSFGFTRAAQRRVSKLLDMNCASTISPAQYEELMALVLLAEMVDLMQLKAELLLRRARK